MLIIGPKTKPYAQASKKHWRMIFKPKLIMEILIDEYINTTICITHYNLILRLLVSLFASSMLEIRPLEAD